MARNDRNNDTRNANDPRDPRTAEGTTAAPDDTQLAATPAAQLGIRKASDADLARLMNDYEVAPEFVTLEAGDLIEGVFVRWGSVKVNRRRGEDIDRLTGQPLPPRDVDTLVVDIGRKTIEFLSAHELGRIFNGIDKGQPLWLVRGPDEKVNGQIVTRYRGGRGKVPRS